MELADDRGHISCRCTGIDLESHGELIGDFSHREPTVTPVPDATGRVIELMDKARPTIEHYRFTFNQANADIRPSLRAMVIYAYLRTGCTTRARLRRQVHPALNERCLGYTVA